MAGTSSLALRYNFPRRYTPRDNTCSVDDFIAAVLEGHLSDVEKPRFTAVGRRGAEGLTLDEVVYYKEMSCAGMRFPLSDPFKRLCRDLKLHPLMLTANGYRFFAGFICLCIEKRWAFSTNVFRFFFQLQLNKQGFFLFKARFPPLEEPDGKLAEWPKKKKLIICRDDSAGWRKKWLCVENNFVDWPVYQLGVSRPRCV